MGILDKIRNIGEENPGSWYLQAKELTESGYYADALEVLDGGLCNNPSHADAWFLKGYVFYQMNRYDESLQVLDRTLGLNPAHHDAFVFKGLISSSQGRHEEAVGLYDRALTINPNLAGAWYARGLALFLLGRYDDAISSYDHALVLDPRHIDALAGINNAMKNRDRILESPLPDSIPGSMKRDRQVPARTENRGTVSGLRGTVIPLRSPDCPVRSAAITPIPGLHPGSGPSSDNPGTRNQARQSPGIRSPGLVPGPHKTVPGVPALTHYEEEVRDIHADLSLNPEDTGSWNALGDISMRAGRFPQAAEAYERSAGIDPEQPEVWSDLGDARRKLGCYDEALVAYQQALIINTEQPRVWVAHARTLAMLGRHEDALVSCERAINLDEMYVDAWQYKAFLCKKIARHEEALTAYDWVRIINDRNDPAVLRKRTPAGGE